MPPEDRPRDDEQPTKEEYEAGEREQAPTPEPDRMDAERLPIDRIKDELLRVHAVATGKSDRAYMSIPADPRRDADLIVMAAIDELAQLRSDRKRLIGMLMSSKGFGSSHRWTRAEIEAELARKEPSRADQQ